MNSRKILLNFRAPSFKLISTKSSINKNSPLFSENKNKIEKENDPNIKNKEQSLPDTEDKPMSPNKVESNKIIHNDHNDYDMHYPQTDESSLY
jgi:hypothetical protein